MSVGVVAILVVALLWVVNGRKRDATLYVGPTGSDGNDGASVARPVRRVQTALERARPGTTIRLLAGDYPERIHTVRAGAPGAPIRIVGPGIGENRRSPGVATVRSGGTVLAVNHSHYVVSDFAIEGQTAVDYRRLPTDLTEVVAGKEAVQDVVESSKLIVVGEARSAEGVSGVTIRNMFLRGAGQECVRLRNGAERNVVEDSVIRWCGLQRSASGGVFAYHNGEGVYIGTSPKSDGQPLAERDPSSWNVIRHNDISTYGTECLDVKENSHDNHFYGNKCKSNTEADDDGGSNVELRGHRNTVSENLIVGSLGWNVKLASDDAVVHQGQNSVRHNFLGGADATNIYVTQRGPGAICGNMASDAEAVTLAGGVETDPAESCAGAR